MGKKIRKLFAVTALTTAGIYCVNRVINYTATLKNLVKSDQGNFFNWKNGNIFYTVHGKGTPLLLVHDLHPASSMAEWSKVIKKLEKNYKVYCIDLLGCGQSDKPAITYTNYLYVQLLNDFVKDVIKEKTTLVATGTSGSFSIMANTMNPDSYEKVIIVNPEDTNSLLQQPDDKKNTCKYLYNCPILGTFLYNIEMHENNIAKLFREEYYYKSSLVSTKIEDIYFESAHLGHGTGRFLYASILSNYTNINITHALSKLNNIYLIESRERPNNIRIIESYTKYNKNIDASYVSNSKYLPQLEVPDKFYDVLKMFLEC